MRVTMKTWSWTRARSSTLTPMGSLAFVESTVSCSIWIESTVWVKSEDVDSVVGLKLTGELDARNSQLAIVVARGSEGCSRRRVPSAAKAVPTTC